MDREENGCVWRPKANTTAVIGRGVDLYDSLIRPKQLKQRALSGLPNGDSRVRRSTKSRVLSAVKLKRVKVKRPRQARTKGIQAYDRARLFGLGQGQ